MKNFTSLLLAGGLFLALPNVVNAQAPRLVLAEEFTQASCGPCALQNPDFNTLLDANSTKIISIKYQTSWPGFDPMNLHNPSEVQTRVNYYGVGGVPNAQIDGVAVPNDCNAYVGAPSCLNQAEIDQAYNSTSPIAVSVTHTMAADLTSATVNVTVTNVGTSAFTSNGTAYLRLALVEEAIEFPTAPGSNGEEEFYSVMRKMVPDDLGTALPASLAAGQMVSNQFTVPMPNYIYNYGEIAFVAFVQSDGDKKVHNADYSAPAPVPAGNADAGCANASISGSDLCDASFTPAITLTNNSATTITSSTTQYSLNGGAAVSQSWTGSLAQGASATITFPATTLSSGSTAFQANIMTVNGQTVNGQIDYNTLNNSAVDNYSVLDPTPQPTPYDKGFEALALGGLPTEFIINDPSGRIYAIDQGISSAVTWAMGGFGGSAKSIRVDFYSIPAGVESEIITEKIDMSTIGAGAKLYFDHAHAQFRTENDMLDVAVSDDCGATWTSVWNRAGSTLATTAPVGTGRFYPVADQWHRQEISLAAYANSADIVVRFKTTSAYGNCLYLDNISVNTTPVSIQENELASLSLYPVPASDFVNIDFNAASQESVTVTVLNQLGAVVNTVEFGANEGNNTLRLDVSALSSGVYTLDIRTNEKNSIRKISVVK
jgi:hypothetical protein